MIVNEKTNTPEGSCSRLEIRGEKRWHRETYIFVSNSHNEYIVYKKPSYADYSPGSFTLAVGDLVKAGESMEEAALRALKEYLGIEVEAEKL